MDGAAAGGEGGGGKERGDSEAWKGNHIKNINVPASKETQGPVTPFSVISLLLPCRDRLPAPLASPPWSSIRW